MALSRAEINQRSNQKRGVINKAFKLNQHTVDLIISLSQQDGISQAQLITQLINDYANSKKPTE